MSSVIYAVRNCSTPWYKIGYWTSSLLSLKKRYTTVYGLDMEWHIFQTLPETDVRTVERLMHRSLRKFWISNEIFEVACLPSFLQTASELCGPRAYMPVARKRASEEQFAVAGRDDFRAMFHSAMPSTTCDKLYDVYVKDHLTIHKRLTNIRAEREKAGLSTGRQARQLETINIITQELGIKGSYEVGAHIDRTVLAKASDRVLSMKRDLQAIFNLRIRETKKRDSLRRGLELLNSVLARWGFTQISSDGGKQKRQRIDGERKTVTDFAVKEQSGYAEFARYT